MANVSMLRLNEAFTSPLDELIMSNDNRSTSISRFSTCTVTYCNVTAQFEFDIITEERTAARFSVAADRISVKANVASFRVRISPG